MNIEKLVQLADAGQISTPLTQIWETRTGINPVIQAREFEKQRHLHQIRWIVWSVGMIFVLLLFSSLLVAAILEHNYQLIPNMTGGTISDPEFVIDKLFLTIICLSVLGILIVTFSSVALIDHLPEKKEAERYAAAYGYFVKWSSLSTNVLSRYDFGRNKLQKTAEGIMVKRAYHILELEKSKDGSGLNSTELEVARGKLNEVHDVLLQLNIAKGRHDEYYRIAEKELTANKKKAKTT